MTRLLAVLLVFCAAAASAVSQTVLVLPFHNSAQVNNLDWVSESAAESIRETLAASGVLALDREDRQEAYARLQLNPQARLTHASVLKLGESLDADVIVYGRFEFSPATEAGAPLLKGSVRFAAEVLDRRKLRRERSVTETGPLPELANLQSQLADRVLRLVAPDAAQGTTARRARVPVDAIENYTRGLLVTAPDAKIKFLLQAVTLAPEYAEAAFQLGKVHYDRRNYRASLEWLEKPSPGSMPFRQSRFLLGLAKFRLGDYVGAQSAFQAVARELPLNEVWNNLGCAQSRLSQPDALESLQRALEGDLSDPTYHFNVGYALYKQGRYNEAADRFRAALDRAPDDKEATRLLGLCLRPGTADTRSTAAERLKENLDESAYHQLRAVLSKKTK